jgi:hypothetical protein
MARCQRSVINGEAPGALKATVRRDNTVLVNFEPAKGDARDFDVYLAYLGFGININVRGGENNGRSLRHHFVVLSLDHQKLVLAHRNFTFVLLRSTLPVARIAPHWPVGLRAQAVSDLFKPSAAGYLITQGRNTNE